MWKHRCKTLLQQKHSGSKIFIPFLHTNAFVDLPIVVIKCDVRLFRQPMSKLILPVVDLLSQVQTWAASWTPSAPALTQSRRSLLRRAWTDCVGTCTPTTTTPFDLHAGDIHRPVAEPHIYVGHLNPLPAPQAEAFIPIASFSSRNSASYVHLYQQL